MNVKDNAILLLIAGAALILTMAFFIPDNGHLLYADAISRLNIGRRVTDSITPGLAQLGTVWLPGQPALISTMAWIDPLYWSGAAAIVWSVAGYLISIILIRQLVFEITRSRRAAFIAALIFLLDRGVLYFSITPMSEILSIGCILIATYGCWRWFRKPREILWTILIALAVGLLVSIRYEGWALLAAIIVFYAAITLLLHKMRGGEILARLIHFGFIPGVGVIGGWMVYNLVLFGGPLAFLTSEYAVRNPDASYMDKTEVVGNLWKTLETYFHIINLVPGALMLGLITLSITVLLFRYKLKYMVFVVGAILVLPAFHILSIYTGQLTVNVMELHGQIYNIRIGMYLVPIAAILSGVMVRKSRPMAIILSALLALNFLHGGGVNAMLQDKQAVLSESAIITAHWLREHVEPGEKVLVETFRINDLLFWSKLPLSTYVTESNYLLWQESLADPSNIRYIVITGYPDDVVKNNVDPVVLERDYQVVLHTEPDLRDLRLIVYERKEG